MKKFKIITGKIRSGKTTFLKRTIPSLQNVKGILQPTLEEERFFEDIETGELKIITALKESDETFRLGRFLFYLKSFLWAKEKLKLTLTNGAETIVIDEYGPLEFKNKGLEPVVSEIIELVKNRNDKDLIIIIRESLVGDFMRKFILTEEDVDITKIN